MASSSTAFPAREPWSKRLADHCTARQFPEPSYQEVSDRRGGRTAWSCIVTVNGQEYSARFWYDGTYALQAREDASEIALRKITGTFNLPQEPPPASYYAAQGGNYGG